MLRCTWDLPGPGLEPVSPASAGGFKKASFFLSLFLAVLALRFCARAFPSCGERGPLLITVRGPLTVAASPAVEHKLQTRRLSNCGSRDQLLHGMWDPSRPGLEPASPAPAGRLPTTAPAGKPSRRILNHCTTREVPVDFIFYKDFFCREQFKVHSQIERKVQRFPIDPFSHSCIASRINNNPHQGGVFVTTDESTLTHHNHAKFIVYLRVLSWVEHSMGFDEYIMTCIHCCSTIQNSSLPLISPVLHLFIPSSPQPLATTNPFTNSTVLPFS